MTKAFGYLRVSGKDQVQGDGFPRQREAIKAYAAANGYRITEWFQEKAIPGKTEWDGRPAWLDMVSKLNGVDVIMVEGLDRLARDLVYRLRSRTKMKRTKTNQHGLTWTEVPGKSEEELRCFEVAGGPPERNPCTVDPRIPHCDQCQMLAINNINTHEHGCPNSKKTWVADRAAWVLFLECRECGCDVEEGEVCGCDEPEEEETIEAIDMEDAQVLLDAAKEAQSAYWDALSALEECIGRELGPDDTDVLESCTLEYLIKGGE